MAEPRSKISPLDWKTPIVDAKTGAPTLQFIRLWQQLFGNEDGTNQIAAAAAPGATIITAGAGLTGGGALTPTPPVINVGAGTGIIVNVDDVAIDTTAEAERIRDVIGAALVAGSNITITVNDPGDTITIAASGGSGGSELDTNVPTLAGWATEVTSATATYNRNDVAGKGVGLECTPGAAGSKHIFRLKTPPATPYTLTGRCRFDVLQGASCESGICLRESSSGITLRMHALGTRAMFAQKWTNDSFNTTITTSATLTMNMGWFRITLDGAGNVAFFYSHDGYRYNAAGTTTLAAQGITSIDQVGFYIRNSVNAASHHAIFPYMDVS